MDSETERVFAELKKYRLLLTTDAQLPNVCALVGGETVRGSRRAHPRSHAIFQVDGELADDLDVLMVTLILTRSPMFTEFSGRRSSLSGVREPWQTEQPSGGACKLPTAVDRKPVQPDKSMNKATSELETKLLVHIEQFHTEPGTHVRRLENWEQRSRRAGFRGQPVPVDDAKLSLASLNQSSAVPTVSLARLMGR